jgi:menaquinol-cytochrome c reductase iron-sulfur subunit
MVEKVENSKEDNNQNQVDINHVEVEKNTQTRKDFIKLSVISLVGFITVLLGWPVIEYLIKPFYRSKKIPYIKTSDFNTIKIGIPTKLGFNIIHKSGFLKQTKYEDVWVIKHSKNRATVFSPICPHLGCRYNWDPLKNEFMCPCHGSIFSINGKVLGGPAPRPLDTLPHKIENGKLYVKWERFVVGIPEKELET